MCVQVSGYVVKKTEPFNQFAHIDPNFAERIVEKLQGSPGHSGPNIARKNSFMVVGQDIVVRATKRTKNGLVASGGIMHNKTLYQQQFLSHNKNITVPWPDDDSGGEYDYISFFP